MWTFRLLRMCRARLAAPPLFLLAACAGELPAKSPPSDSASPAADAPPDTDETWTYPDTTDTGGCPWCDSATLGDPRAFGPDQADFTLSSGGWPGLGQALAGADGMLPDAVPSLIVGAPSAVGIFPASPSAPPHEAAAWLVNDGEAWGLGDNVAVLPQTPAGPALAFGAYREGFFYGAVYLLVGPFSETRPISTAEMRFSAPDALERLGKTIAFAGDQTGDGYDDVLVGAPGPGLYASAAVVLLDGARTGELAEDDAVAILTSEEDDPIGDALASAGDLDGDGTEELLVGSANRWMPDGTREGGAWVVRGPLAGPVRVQDVASRVSGPGSAGTIVAGLGDLDGDGYAEFAVYDAATSIASTGSGAVYVLAGSPILPLSTDEAVAVLALGSCSSGASELLSGDLDGDGETDLVLSGVTDPTLWCGGVDGVLVTFGPFAGSRTLGGDTDLFIATEVPGGVPASAWCPDLDADGRDELSIGTVTWGTDPGAVALYTAATLLTE